MATATGGKVAQKLLVTRWLVNCGNKRLVLRRGEKSIRGRPDEHIQRGDERHKDQQPRAKRLRREADFLQQPGAEILQRENVTAPAADKTPEDQRRQNRQSKEDKSRVDRAALERIHRLGRLDRRDRLAHQTPLDDVRDHQQGQSDKSRRPPAAGP